MENPTWRPFHAVAITTHPIPAYGGFQAPLELLERMAAHFNGGAVPMHANHDLTNPIRTRGMRAQVRRRRDAYHELVLEGEVHAEDWQRVQHMSGMSVTVMDPLRNAFGTSEAHLSDEGSVVTIAADAGWFDDEAIIEAAAQAAAASPAQPTRAYQFGLVPDPQIFVELTYAVLQGLGPNLAASAIWDGLKYLLSQRRTPENGDPATETVVNFTVTDQGWTAVVASNDADVVERAIQNLASAANAALGDGGRPNETAPWTWDAQHGIWVPATPPLPPRVRDQ